MAYKKFGAVMGQPFGLQGQSFAIPTVGDGIGPHEIAQGFHRLVEGEVEYLQLDVQNGCLGSNHAKSREKSLKSREKTLFLQQKVGRKWLQ